MDSTSPYYEHYGFFFRIFCRAINNSEMCLRDLYMINEHDKNPDEYPKSHF